MISLEVLRRDGLRVLCLGAHSDDIEIGCGGTILRLLADNPSASVDWVVFSGNAARATEARASAADFLSGAKTSRVHLFEFEDSFMPWHGKAIKEKFESLKPLAPDVVFTHFRRDMHQDHRLLGELTWNTFRNHLVLEYEIVKYEGDLVTPNVYVPLDEATCARKIELLEKHFGSQRNRHWFEPELFRSLLRIRGVECASRYAEAFHAAKVVL